MAHSVACDWRQDLEIELDLRERGAMLMAESGDIAHLCQSLDLSPGELLNLDAQAASVAIEYALAPAFDEWQRRSGLRPFVRGLRRADGQSGVEVVERQIVVDDRPIRLGLAVAPDDRLARAFLALGSELPPERAPEPPACHWRLGVGPLSVAPEDLSAVTPGDVLALEARSAPAALMAPDGAFWTRLRIEPRGMRVEAKRGAPMPSGVLIVIQAPAPSPRDLLVGDWLAPLMVDARARLVVRGVAVAEGRVVEIDGGLGFQIENEFRAAAR